MLHCPAWVCLRACGGVCSKWGRVQCVGVYSVRVYVQCAEVWEGGAVHRDACVHGGAGIDPTNAAHRAYLDRFVADFEAEMQRGIDRHAQIISDAQKTPLVYDIANHMQYAKMKGTDCVGRVSLINSILRYVDAPSADHPLIVYGPSGSGKTCLVAKACTEAFTRLTARADGVHPVFLVRFLNQVGVCMCM